MRLPYYAHEDAGNLKQALRLYRVTLAGAGRARDPDQSLGKTVRQNLDRVRAAAGSRSVIPRATRPPSAQSIRHQPPNQSPRARPAAEAVRRCLPPSRRALARAELVLLPSALRCG